MVKRRPAVVLSPPIPGRNLCTIVPLSTSEPRIPLAHHLKLYFSPRLPAPYDSDEMWLKGDILLTVGFHRLRHLQHRNENGEREYDVRVLDVATFEKVRDCIKRGLGLNNWLFSKEWRILWVSLVPPAFKSSASWPP
jgi:uncharacterized protein YifN (PemK superfamily)